VLHNVFAVLLLSYSSENMGKTQKSTGISFRQPEVKPEQE